MQIVKKMLLSLLVVLAMTVSVNVSAAEKTIKPAEAIEIALAKVQVVINAVKAGSSAEDVNKLIRDAMDATGEIYSNYKTDKARDTAIIHLRAIRTKVKEGKTAEVEEALQNALKEIDNLKSII
ncbi:MAG: hypothetical protein NTV43_05645 [Methylococcales bacterium]|nr:hypothetical protein [Methylococcales bacterium]